MPTLFQFPYNKYLKNLVYARPCVCKIFITRHRWRGHWVIMRRLSKKVYCCLHCFIYTTVMLPDNLNVQIMPLVVYCAHLVYSVISSPCVLKYDESLKIQVWQAIRYWFIFVFSWTHSLMYSQCALLMFWFVFSFFKTPKRWAIFVWWTIYSTYTAFQVAWHLRD